MKSEQRASEKSAGRTGFYNLVIDPIFVAIFVVSFVTRFYRLDHPRAVVFDELHYIKFITLYSKRIFFFDAQPPFGKQLLTIASQLFNFAGDLSYSQIGDEYKPDVPITGLRFLPCLFGALVPPSSYIVGRELRFRRSTAAFSALLLVFENALLTQSRFILLDPILIFFTVSALYCYLKFTQDYSNAWLSLAATSATLAACTKYSGFYTYILLFGLVTFTWWSVLDRWDTGILFKQTVSFLACLFLLPIVIYLSIYYAHLTWLTRAGPHDSIMTSAFQASLENGLASIIRGQPLEILHGSQITLRHTHGRNCWLHSHEHLYPVKYPDGRGSSHQQQVTCYSFKDVNNWWIIKRPHIDELVVTEPHDKLKDGDLIQLVHGMSGRTLNSHDVAAAMSPYSQEVSCYVDHNISMPAQDVWQIRLSNPQDTNGYWHTINSRLQLIHLNSSFALRFSGSQLPDWGFHQHEVVADKEFDSSSNIWNVEEHRYTKSDDQKEREIQFGQAEFVPLQPTSLSFFEKLVELHYKLLIYQHDTMKDHIYACESPLDWIFMNRGTAYWVVNALNDEAQIFLIGNVRNSIMGLMAIMTFASFMLFYIMRRRRQIMDDLSEDNWAKLELQATVLLGGYLMHFLPYFLYESPLFLQYYLCALVFKMLLIGASLDHLYDVASDKHYLVHGIMFLATALSFDAWRKLSPLSYGSSLTRDDVESLKWKETWQLISTNV